MISAGYDPEFIRWGCTIRDFKLFLLASMRDRIEEQQNFSMAVMVAVASVFDSKAGADISAKLKDVIENLDQEQQALFGPLPEDNSDMVGSTVNTEQKDASGLSKKQVKAWKNAAKIDALMSKMLGKPTGAPWSNATDGNVSQPIDKGRLESITGESILKTMENMRSRIPAGPARRASSVKPGTRK